jgi:hypothetical protein
VFVFVFVQFPEDDGYCSSLTTAVECEERKSMFDDAESTCGWQESESVCAYRKVEFTVRVRNSILFAC